MGCRSPLMSLRVVHHTREPVTATGPVKPGDHINIPARQKHRGEWTHPDMTIVWLCVFY